MLINRYVIHVLDKNNLILNDFECKNNLSAEDFINKQIKKVLNSDYLRKAKFNEEENLVRNVSSNMVYSEFFLNGSKEIASCLYDYMLEDENMNSCDLLIASISIKDHDCIAIMKLDYKKLHNHKIDFVDDKFNIQMIENEIGIQNTSIKQAAVIDINSLNTKYDLYVLDVDAEKNKSESVFTKDFLNVTKIEDDTQLTKEFIGSMKYWINNSVVDPSVAEEIRKNLNDILTNSTVLDLDKFIDIALEYEEDKENFKRFILKNNLKNFNIDKTVVEKKLKKRKIKTDTGLEISSDLIEFYDPTKFKLSLNIDGSYDLIIKNVKYFYEK